MLEKIEKKVFFNTTRVFAWIVIVPAFIAMLYAGFGLLGSYVQGKKAIIVTSADVKTEIYRQETRWSANEASGIQQRERKADEWKHEKELQTFFNAFGFPIDKERATQYFKEMIMKIEPQDRTQFINGMTNVINSLPTDKDKRLKAIDAYVSLWEKAKTARDYEFAANKMDRASQFQLFATSFAAIALFSLMLILLAIEKNTRGIPNAPTPVKILKPDEYCCKRCGAAVKEEDKFCSNCGDNVFAVV